MTERHVLGRKHRMLHINASLDGWKVRLLRKPLLHTNDTRRADRSRFPYGVCAMGSRCPNDVGRAPRPPQPECYTLSLLGILHGVFGLTLCTWARPCPVHDELSDSDE